MDMIEIFFQSNEALKKRISYSFCDAVIGVNTRVTYQSINQLMGPTFPPRVIGNLAMLSYEGANFVFCYPTVDLSSLLGEGGSGTALLD